jgi:tetratricopeptide (TPR) repeat protein
VLFALVAVLWGGFWAYAVYQWRAAEAALRAERLDEAQERLAFCLKVWPRNPDVLLLAARTSRLTGHFPEAEAQLNRCIQLQGGATERVQLEFLLMRVQAGEMDELAPALFDLVDKGHPETPAILETIARSYMHRLRYKPAFHCLNRWIALQPHNAKPVHWRGWVLERLNNPKGAKDDYEHALELDPTLISVRLRLVEMFLEDKLVPDAVPHLEILYRQAPNDARVRARLGMCRFHQGQTKDARQLMEAALVEMPNDAPLLTALANLDLQEGRGAESERKFRLVLEADPFDTEALFGLASALQFQNRTTEAAAVLADHERKRALVTRANALLKDVADSPTATANNYVELGDLFLQMGRDKVALYWLDRALERDPTNTRAHRALASYYEGKGDRARAAAHRQQIREPAPVPPPGAARP